MSDNNNTDANTAGVTTVTTENVQPTTTTAAVQQQDNNNIGTTATSTTDDIQLLNKIQKQIEFYFSNSNLPKDKFLKSLYDQDNGWIDLSVIATFKRMQSLTHDINLVIKAIQHSKQIKLSHDNQRVTRVEPLPDHVSNTKQTIFVSNLPDNADIDSLTEYFNTLCKQDDAVLAVRLHRKKHFIKQETNNNAVDTTESTTVTKSEDGSVQVESNTESHTNSDNNHNTTTSTTTTTDNKPTITREFDGTAMIEFRTPELAQYIVYEISKQQELKYNDTIVNVQLKTQWLESMKDNNNNKRKRGHDSTDDNTNAKQEDDEQKEPEQPDFPRDKLFQLTNINGDKTTRESLREFIEKLNPANKITYLDYARGRNDAVIRLADDDDIGASKLVENMNNNKEQLILDDNNITVSIITGEQESDIWKTIRQNRTQHRKILNDNKRGRGRGRGGKKQRR